MTTALAIVLCPSHSFPNFTALVAAVALSEAASKKARTRMQKRSVGMYGESRIDVLPLPSRKIATKLHVHEAIRSGTRFPIDRYCRWPPGLANCVAAH